MIMLIIRLYVTEKTGKHSGCPVIIIIMIITIVAVDIDELESVTSRLELLNVCVIWKFFSCLMSLKSIKYVHKVAPTVVVACFLPASCQSLSSRLMVFY